MPTAAARADDDLLVPSLQEHEPEARRAQRPWRLGSQIYVAFLGASIAVAVIALLNARRLRVPPKGQAIIVAAGLAGAAISMAAAAVAFSGPDASRGLRVVVQLLSTLAWGPMFLVQRPHDRIYQVFYTQNVPEDEVYESLLAPGLAAVVGGGLAQTSLVGLVA